MQRIFDIFFSGLALIALSPLFLPLMLLLRLTGEGEIFFKQERIGRGGRPFYLLKFATMLKESPNMGTGTVTVTDDPRILPVGRVLRKTKLNELPQLINVIKGDMSLIGPRPQTRRCFDAFPREHREEIKRVRPGLSGLGAIVFRGEEEMYADTDDPDRFYDEVIMPYKGELERWYVRNKSLGRYFLLICLTVWVVLFPALGVLWRALPGLPQPPQELKGKV